MSLADQMMAAMKTVEEDGKAVIEVRDYYIKNHVKNRYADHELEVLFFNDDSLICAKTDGEGGANVIVVEREDLGDFIDELESTQRINNGE